MNILVLCQYFYPEQFQINDIVEALVKKNNRVTVLTGIPNYPKGEIYPEYKNYSEEYEFIFGATIYRCNIRPRKTGKINLFLNYLSFYKQASKKIAQIDELFDVIYIYQLSPVIQALPALKYKKNPNCKKFLYCLDVYPLSGINYYKKIPFAYNIVKDISKKIYKSVDKIGVTSKSFINYLESVCEIQNDKIVYLPQHVDDSLRKIRFENEENGKFDILFAGNIGRGAKLDVLIDAVYKVKDKNNIMVHIVGDGTDLNRIQKLVREKQLTPYFKFYGLKKREDMLQYYNLADALFLSLRKGNITMPLKFLSYLSTGKPIIAALDGSVCEIMNEIHCGLCTEAENSICLAEIIETYLSKRAPSINSDNIRNYFSEHFTLEIHMANLIRELNCLIGE